MKINPPHPVSRGALGHWRALVSEIAHAGKLGGHDRIRLALTAEDQAAWLAGRADPGQLAQLERNRRYFGLDPLPDLEAPIYLDLAKTAPKSMRNRTGAPLQRPHQRAYR